MNDEVRSAVAELIKGYLGSGSTCEFDDPHLEKLIRLLKRYEPERIILFGSRARGDADEYSDQDVIVVRRAGKPFLERLRETGLDWADHNEGVVLYERL